MRSVLPKGPFGYAQGDNTFIATLYHHVILSLINNLARIVVLSGAQRRRISMRSVLCKGPFDYAQGDTNLYSELVEF